MKQTLVCSSEAEVAAKYDELPDVEEEGEAPDKSDNWIVKIQIYRIQKNLIGINIRIYLAGRHTILEFAFFSDYTITYAIYIARHQCVD